MIFNICYQIGKGEAREKLETAMQGVNDRYTQLEEVEKTYVRKALIEERKHYCEFICCLRPVVVSQLFPSFTTIHTKSIHQH